MIAMVCPNCGAQVTAIANKPYCARCGWNINSAENAVRAKANVILAAVLLCAGLLGYGAFVRGGNAAFEIAAVIVLCATIPLYRYLRSVPLGILELLRTQTRREAARADSPRQAGGPASQWTSGFRVRAEPPGARAPAGPATSQKGTADERLRRLEYLPTPREVRITRRGIFYVLLGAPAALGAAGLYGYLAWEGAMSAGSLSAFTQQEWLTIVAALIFFGISVHVLRKLLWDRRLLRDGVVTLGRVTGQRTARNYRQSSTVVYSFSDAAARVFTNRGADYSTEYYEGMWVVVFYDPSRPQKSVAEGGTLYSLDEGPRSD